MDKNVCPYCGWECVEIVGSPYSGIGRGRCPNCQSHGPDVSPPSAAIAAFCHPAHLMETLHTYNPATEVVIKRESAIVLAMNVRGISDADEAAADLTAALEVRHVRD